MTYSNQRRLLGVLLVAVSLLVTGCAAESPTAEGTSTEVAPQTNPEVTFPEEAKPFIDRNGNLYSDPLATYYASTEYETQNGQGLVLDEAYVNQYDFNSLVMQNGETSPLGFGLNKIDPSRSLDLPALNDIFNQSIPELNRIANMLAKNPTSERVAVIKDELKKYPGFGDKDGFIANLVDNLTELTSKYGSNANYDIKPTQGDGTQESKDSSFFTAPSVAIDAVDSDKKIMAHMHLWS